MTNDHQCRLWRFLLVLGVLATISCALAGTYRERFEQTLPLSEGGRFWLENDNGSIHLVAWSRQEVRIEAEKVAKAGSEEEAQRLLERTEIVVEQRGDEIEVRTRTPRGGSGSLWGWMFGHDGGVYVNYSISVPEDIFMNVRSSNGAITAQEISGEIELKTTNGRLELEDARGKVLAETTNGAIVVSLRQIAPDADLRFETTNGSIKANLPSDYAGRISARTVNGSIKCDFPLRHEKKSSRHHLEGFAGDGDNRASFRTTNGSITIRSM